MGHGHGERIGRIRRRGFAEAEQRAHHEGHLVLLRPAAADGGLLDLTRSVFVDGQPVLGGGDQGGSSRGAEHDGRFETLDKDRGLDGANGGGVLADHFDQGLADGDEAAARQEGGLVLNDAPGEGSHVTTVSLDDGVAGLAQRGIDGEDTLGFGGGGGFRWAEESGHDGMKSITPRRATCEHFVIAGQGSFR